MKLHSISTKTKNNSSDVSWSEGPGPACLWIIEVSSVQFSDVSKCYQTFHLRYNYVIVSLD